MADAAAAERYLAGNWRLYEARTRRGWSQRATASALRVLAVSLGEAEPSVDARQVRWWEQGRHTPRLYYVRLLCLLFQAAPEKLGLPPLPPELLEELAVKRRQFLLSSIGTVLGGSTLSAWSESSERLQALVGANQLRPDQQAVRDLEQITIWLEELEPQSSPAAAIGPARGHLQNLAQLLRNPLPSDHRRQLCSLAGETAGLIGWLSWNLEDQAANAYFRLGLQAAREADDPPLTAYLLGRSACQPLYRERPEERLKTLRSCRQADASPATRAWLATQEAEAYALAGSSTLCQRALDRSEHLLDRAGGEGGRRPRATFFDRTWLHWETGFSLVTLGQPEAARAALNLTLSSLEPHRVKDRIWLDVALAGTYAQQGAAEEACRLGSQALGQAEDVGLQSIRGMLLGLRRELEPQRTNPAVQEFGDQLRAAGIMEV